MAIHSSTDVAPLDVAIVGGGIIGVMTALGLLQRGIKVTIYERASNWHEIGAGFAFTAVARDCMHRMDPQILEVLSKISQKTDPNASTAYWNGYNPRTKDDAEDESSSLLFKMPGNKLAFWGCVRSHFLLGMAGLLPDGVVKFGKQLVSYEDEIKSEHVTLRFTDGTSAQAHAVLGCDGIHSTTRKILFGADHPATRPGYTHTVAYRAMVPIDAGIAALGEKKALSGCMHCGPNGNIMSYPVMNGTLLNVAIFIHDPAPFPDPERMTVPASCAELEQALSGWGPHITDLAKNFPETMVKWGIFDMDQHAPPTYSSGRVCLVGDAAHASSPFQGVGACIGVEDALAICEALDTARERNLGLPRPDERNLVVKVALEVYTRARLHRGHWVMRSSREMGEIYQWRFGPTGRDDALSQMKLETASKHVWNYDVGCLVNQVRAAVATG